MRFSLRYLLAVLIGCTLFFAIGRQAGPFQAPLIACLALLAVAGGFAWPAHRPLAWSLFLMSALGTWLLAVDVVSVPWRCGHCSVGHDDWQVRVLGHALHQTRSAHPSLLAAIAEDLGDPCPHRLEPWRPQIWAGGFLPVTDDARVRSVADWIYGPYELPHWYVDRGRPILRAQTDRSRPREFREALLLGDLGYLHDYIDQLERQSRAPSRDPPGDSGPSRLLQSQP